MSSVQRLFVHNGDPLPSWSDRGAISARNTSKGALLREAQAVFSALASGASVKEARDLCLSGRILRQSARITRQHIWDALNWRYFLWGPPQWVVDDIKRAAAGEPANPLFVRLAYVHYARRDRLTFEFVTTKLYESARTSGCRVDRNDVLEFLLHKESNEPQVRRWRDTTRKKLAGNVLSALRDFGIVAGVQSKSVQHPGNSREGGASFVPTSLRGGTTRAETGRGEGLAAIPLESVGDRPSNGSARPSRRNPL